MHCIKFAFIIGIFQEIIEYNINFNNEYNKKNIQRISCSTIFIKRLRKNLISLMKF